jgi:DNA-binding protein HU-beta
VRYSAFDVFSIIMTKDGLSDAVQSAAELPTKAAANRAVDAVFSSIEQALSRGEDVTVTGFGTFRVTRRSARMGRNPRTGEPVQIKAMNVPKFKAGKGLKEAVN